MKPDSVGEVVTVADLKGQKVVHPINGQQKQQCLNAALRLSKPPPTRTAGAFHESAYL